MRKMNILYLCDEYPPSANGGIGSSVKLLAEAMQKNGHNIYVAGMYPSFRKIGAATSIENGVKVFKMGYFPFQNRYLSNFIIYKLFKSYLDYRFKKYLAFLKQIISQYNIRIVEIPDYQEIFFNAISERFHYDFNIPIVVKTHGSYGYIAKSKNQSLNSKVLKKESKLYSSAKAIICLSRFAEQMTISLYGKQLANKMVIIPHGIVIPPNYDCKEKRADDVINVIFAGSITRTKGVYELISAWDIVCSQTNMDIKLHLYGKFEKSVHLALNKTLSSANKEKVTFHGHVDAETLTKGYKSAAFAILPSHFETFGMVAIEAMSYGCPVIFTERASGPEIIQNGHNGYLINPSNIQQMAERMLDLINNQQLRTKLASNAVQDVYQKYDIAKTTLEHEKIYSKFIQ